MRYATVFLLTSIFVASGCKKGDSSAKEVPANPTHTEVVEEEKAPEPNCPSIMLHGKKKFLCEVSYTNFKDYQLDGKSAVGKRAKFRCRYERIANSRMWCKIGGIKYVFPEIDEMGDVAKGVLRDLKKGQKVVVDGAISGIGALGPRLVTFSLEPVK